ncbi:MAG: type II toxin-antitoxin system RelE/ParE family toxin [Candidatus Hydrogenedentes bacterium]|nr:type II toxin-antitoxin system RelE/ParE family toxin [Candidatus Hydrogenedentota bacterium]
MTRVTTTKAREDFANVLRRVNKDGERILLHDAEQSCRDAYSLRSRTGTAWLEVKYRLQILPSAEKDMASLAIVLRRRVNAAILLLADDPRPPGCKALKGKFRGLYRIRVGDYRVVYRVKDDVLILIIISVAHRSQVY